MFVDCISVRFLSRYPRSPSRLQSHCFTVSVKASGPHRYQIPLYAFSRISDSPNENCTQNSWLCERYANNRKTVRLRGEFRVLSSLNNHAVFVSIVRKLPDSSSVSKTGLARPGIITANSRQTALPNSTAKRRQSKLFKA